MNVGALFLGILFSLVFKPKAELSKKLSVFFLQISIIGLGAGMNLDKVAQVGMQGFGYTVAGITFTFLIGLLLMKLLKADKEVSVLLSVGTAICGGSAIAAVGPVIRAKNESMTVAVGTVFILNASALVFFPWLGHLFELTQSQFGLFSALAVHDTSSVVATSMQYGPDALAVATTVKLARALWIVPVTIAIGLVWKSDEKPKRILPLFIVGFLITSALVTWIPELAPIGHKIADAAKMTLALALFFIGSGMNPKSIKSVGMKPLALGILLWILVGGLTLAAIKTGLFS